MGPQMGTVGKMITGLVVLAYVIVVLCGFFYIAIRLSFLMAPVTVAERRVSRSFAPGSSVGEISGGCLLSFCRSLSRS